MTRRARVLVLGMLLLAVPVLAGACDGIGQPIVGERRDGDGGLDHTCSGSASCTLVRTLPGDHFVIDTAMRAPLETTHLDCDADGRPNAEDNCPGVPNPSQRMDTTCRAARDACERLRAGETDLTGLGSLNGCRLEDAVELHGDLDLRGIDITCADLRFTSQTPARVQLGESWAEHVLLTLRGPIDLDIDTLSSSVGAFALAAGARVRLNNTALSDFRVIIDPTSLVALGPARPTFDARASNLERLTLWEPPSSRPGHVRLDTSTLVSARLVAPSVEVTQSHVVGTRVATENLSIQRAEIVSSELSALRANLSSVEMRDVIFAECVDLRISDSLLTDVDVPLCTPDRFVLYRTEVEGSRLAGGIWATESEISASVLTGGPQSTLRTEASTLDGVRFCDLEAATFRDGALKCLACADDAFMAGRSVCVNNVAIDEGSCVVVEQAPGCGFGGTSP